MASRIEINIPAGGILEQPFTLASPEQEKRGSPPDVVKWSVVVLNELTIDLQINGATGEATGDDRPVFKKARGTTFSGEIKPGPEVGEIIFAFSNDFSWFTAKDIEVIVVCDWNEPLLPSSDVPRLPALLDGRLPGRKGKFPCPPAKPDDAPALTGACVMGDEATETATAAFAEELLRFLEAAELSAPKEESDNQWLKELRERAEDLRELCRRGPGPRASAADVAEANATEQPQVLQEPQEVASGLEDAAGAGDRIEAAAPGRRELHGPYAGMEIVD